MNVVERMATDTEFGMITKISYSSPMPNGGFRAITQTEYMVKIGSGAERIRLACECVVFQHWGEHPYLDRPLMDCTKTYNI